MTIRSSPREKLVRHFQLQVLNGLEFDCSRADLDCASRTSVLRETFAPLIEDAIRYY